MRDWNKDGEIDERDWLHDYIIYTELLNDSSSNYSSSGSGMTRLGIELLIFGILIILVKVFGG